MFRVCAFATCGLIAGILSGCGGDSKRAPAPVPVATANPESDAGTKSADSTDSPETGKAKTGNNAKEAAPADPTIPWELKLEGISVLVPPSWKKVEPMFKIIEAEFQIPRVEGDEYDGRLTIMPSGGDNQSNIDRWKGEFIQKGDEPPKIETVKIDGVETTWVDLRGDWRGSSGAPGAKPQPPRTDYRMLAVIIPFSESSQYFIKLTGPRETIAAREEEFRSFVKSAHLRAPAR